MLGLISLTSQAKMEDISMYPKAEEGMKREIFWLREEEKEEDYKIELRFGKDVEVDCNRHFFLGGKLEEEDVEGWGYPMYVFRGSGEMAGTRMMCHDPKTVKRVYYNIDNGLQRYHSALPLVVYSPKDVKVELHLWKNMGRIDKLDFHK